MPGKIAAAYQVAKYLKPPASGPYSKKLDYALKQISKFNEMINSEKKHVDTSISTAISSTAGVVTLLTALDQGDGESQRVGDSVLMNSLYLQGYYVINASATRSMLRTCVVLDKRPDMGTPTWSSVYSAVSVNALRNIDTLQDRFKILYERFDVVDQNSNGLKRWSKYIKLPKKLHARFDADTSADQSTNAIWLLQVSTEPTNTPSQAVATRLRYYDN